MSLPADLPLPDEAMIMRYMQRLMAKSVTGVAALERATGPIITGWVVVASLICGLRLGFAGAMPGSEAMQPAIVTGFATYALVIRSEEHTSELQSLMRISYAVFCLKKKQNT